MEAKRAEAAGADLVYGHALSKRRRLNPFIEAEFVAERAEKVEASVRVTIEHPFRVIKWPFGAMKVRYRRLAKNTAQIVTLFALSNLWIAQATDAGRG